MLPTHVGLALSGVTYDVCSQGYRADRSSPRLPPPTSDSP